MIKRWLNVSDDGPSLSQLYRDTQPHMGMLNVNKTTSRSGPKLINRAKLLGGPDRNDSL